MYEDYRLHKERIYQATVSIARSMTVDWEREIHGVTAGLNVLAASEELARGDLRGFHAKARQIAQLQNVDSYVLVDARRMQILNTAHDYARPAVPASAPQGALDRVFSDRTLMQTDLFNTRATNRYLVAIGVPVIVNNEVRYSLQAGISPEAIGRLLRRQALGEGWVAALLDSQGIIAGRTREESRFIGHPAVPSLRRAIENRAENTLESTTKEGAPVFTAFTHLGREVGRGRGRTREFPLEELIASLAKVILAGIAFVGLGVALAVWMARAIERSIAALIEPAIELGRGGTFVAPPTHFVETAALGSALTETSRMLARAQQLAYHDPLTGLCNRVLFGELASQTLAAAASARRQVAILAIDLDHFKDVNDTQGHAMGDAVLEFVAQRMKTTFRASDIIARFGGDEFFVLMDDSNAETALSAANNLIRSLSRPYPGVEATVGASVGISIFPADGSDLASLLSEADAALYAAKDAGRGQALRRSAQD
ncbi:sensor domain-containing diguanylate cyclase [Achromobacter xylosoxidans]